MIPSVSFYRFPLITAGITHARAEEIRYLPKNNGSFIDGWVFTCMNLQTLQRCSGKYGIYVSCDGTYTLTNNDWVLLNLISETIFDTHGGKFHSRTCLNDSVD
jgi:hypothetical protein